MTLVNVVPPEELTGPHLIAEYRELPRVFKLVKAAQLRGLTPATVGVPSQYTVKTGHLKFFYPKCLFLLRRQQSLIREMRRRDYKTFFGGYPNDFLIGIEPHWLNDWEPDDMALYLNRLRIRERLKAQETK